MSQHDAEIVRLREEHRLMRAKLARYRRVMDLHVCEIVADREGPGRDHAEIVRLREALRKIADEHEPDIAIRGDWCRVCKERWPCVTRHEADAGLSEEVPL